MPLRTRVALLFVASLFALFAFAYVKFFLRPLPYGMVLFVADGLSPELIAAARAYSTSPDKALALEQFRRVALMRTAAADQLIPDAGAAASAISTGSPAPNGTIGLDARQQRLDNLIYRAQRRGRPTGLLTTGEVTDPACAAFYGHFVDSRNGNELAAQYLDSSRIDVLLGGGARFFLPRGERTGEREDGRDLLKEARIRSFHVVSSRAELEAVSSWTSERVVGLFQDGPLNFQADILRWFPGKENPTPQPRLAGMVEKTIEILQVKSYQFPRGRIRGYLLVVHTGQLARAIEQNQAQRALREVLELDAAVKAARAYGGKDTLIVVTGNRSVGGFTLSGTPPATISGDGVLSNPAVDLGWSSGPGGTPTNANDRAEWERRRAAETAPTDVTSVEFRQPALRYKSAAGGTAGDVTVFADGQGADALPSFLSAEALHQFLADQL